MRIAVCLYGLAGSFNNFNSTQNWIEINDDTSVCEIGHRHYKEHLFKKNKNVDVFIHTWSVEEKETLNKLYSPKKAIYQEQIYFDDFPNFDVPKLQKKALGCKSRWFSTKEVIELKKGYEKENDFVYDFVFLTRMDVAFMTDIDFGKLDKRFFYVGGQKNPQHVHMCSEDLISDWWFISNSELIDQFGSAYDEYDKHAVKSFWYDQHRFARAKINDMNIGGELKFLFNRDDDNKLARELLSNPQCKNRGNWWNYDKKTKLFSPDKKLPTSELNPGRTRHPNWRE